MGMFDFLKNNAVEIIHVKKDGLNRYDRAVIKMDPKELTAKKADELLSLSEEYRKKGIVLRLDFPSMTGMPSSEIFDRLSVKDKLGNHTENIEIRIRNGLNEDKLPRMAEYAEDRTIYRPDHVASILREFEKIESKMDPKWPDLTKALFIYQTIAENVVYNGSMALARVNDVYTDSRRNLLGIVNRECVCSGFAQIYKAAMNHAGLKCQYVNKPHHHSWNHIQVDGKIYAVDLTFDASGKTLTHFGTDKDFYKDPDHRADRREYPECDKISFLTPEQLKKCREQIRPVQKKEKVLNLINERGGIQTSRMLQLSNGERLGIAALKSVKPGYFEYLTGYCDKEGKIDYNKEVIKFFSKEDLMTLPANKVWDEIQTIRNRQQNLVEIKKEEFLQELDNRGENGRKGTLFARNDGSKFALVRLKNPKYAEVHEYLLAEMDSDGKPNYMNISRIYSEMDLFQPQWRQDVADKLLSQKRVEEKVKNVGGYVGYIDNHHKKYNPALEKLIGNYVR